jgi:hypothetical protein
MGSRRMVRRGCDYLFLFVTVKKTLEKGEEEEGEKIFLVG